MPARVPAQAQTSGRTTEPAGRPPDVHTDRPHAPLPARAVGAASALPSVANLTKVRRKQIVKSKKDTDKRAEKAIAVADRDERRVEKMAIKAALKQRWKKLWE